MQSDIDTQISAIAATLAAMSNDNDDTDDTDDDDTVTSDFVAWCCQQPKQQAPWVACSTHI